jgi:hypothetical protein
MRDYRAYILGIDGHCFVRVEAFLSDHPHDEAALRAAKELVDGHEVELWDCGRLVARFSPDGEISSPELAPVKISTDSEHKSNHPTAEVFSLKQVSGLAGVQSKRNPLLLGW